MSTFTNFAIRHEYASLAALGNRVGDVRGLIDWDALRPLLADLYTNTEGRGGRPNYDVVLMIRLLVLQQWYGLSDPELERQATALFRVSGDHTGSVDGLAVPGTPGQNRERYCDMG